MIKEYWPEIINKLEKVNSKITNFLEEVTLSDFDGSLLSIELLNGHKFQQKTLEKDTVEIAPYTNELLNRASETENLITGTLVKRVSADIEYEGFITGTGWETAVLIP